MTKKGVARLVRFLVRAAKPAAVLLAVLSVGVVLPDTWASGPENGEDPPSA